MNTSFCSENCNILSRAKVGSPTNPPWAPASDKTQTAHLIRPFLLRQGEPGTSQYIVHVICNAGPVCIYISNNHYKKKHSDQIRNLAILHWMQWSCHDVPDEYQPYEYKKNWFYSDLTISITIAPAKLQNSGFSNFREMYRKPLHIIKFCELIVITVYFIIKMQLDVDKEPIFRFTYMRYCRVPAGRGLQQTAQAAARHHPVTYFIRSRIFQPSFKVLAPFS